MRPRCEVCETYHDLMCCAVDDQPALWFCRKHLIEHQREAHGLIVSWAKDDA
jgi:hypothetical protein